MNVDECIADLRSAIGAETALARRGAIEDFLEAAARVRGALTAAERHAALDDASRTFAGEPAALGFLRTLASSRITPEDQHLRAQRFARVRVAEIQLYHAAAMKAGRASGNVYAALKSQMDAAREAYREQFLTPVNGTADYLHVEFVRTLANDNAALLGPDYPGSLV